MAKAIGLILTITSLMLGGSNHVAQATRLADAVSSYLYRDRPGNERKAARKKKKS